MAERCSMVCCSAMPAMPAPCSMPPRSSTSTPGAAWTSPFWGWASSMPRATSICGTFAAKGVKLQTGDGRMRVLQQGSVRKLVRQVDQITFSGPQSLVRGQQVLYLTERASFRLTPQGLELFELAPGIDLQRDVLDQMDFRPLIASELATMAQAHFCESKVPALEA